MTIYIGCTDLHVSYLANEKTMTKDNNMSPVSTEIKMDKVSRSNRTWQGRAEEDVIAPCKEKLQQMLSCCQDVAQIVETLEAHMKFGRLEGASAMQEVGGTKIEIILLQDELRRSKLKYAEMEEKVQALSAQLMVYKEDFDLERQDRERAQSRLIELEQQLLFYQRLCGSYLPRSTLEPCAANAPHFHQSPGSHNHQCHYLSTELTARGRDVCDYYQTDGVAEDENTTGKRPVPSCFVTEDAAKQDLNLDSYSSVQLKAQSFDIRDFFPATADAEKSVDAVSSKPLDVRRTVVDEDGGNATQRGTLSTDGIELPLPRTAVLAGGKLHAFAIPFEAHLPHSDSHPQSGASALGKQLMHKDKSLKDSCSATSWSFLSKDLAETSLGNLNLYETDAPRHLLPESRLDNSNLKCPKCYMPFSRSDHLLLLDHLEEC